MAEKEETVTINKSTFYHLIILVLVIGLVASVFTGGFGFNSQTKTVVINNTNPNSVPNPNPNPAPNPAPKAADQKASISIPSYVPFLGDKSAKLNVLEFGDYQCPYCQLFFQQDEAQLRKEYVDTGKVKYYFMDFPFLGSDSNSLSEGAWCANEQGKYYEYHDYMYTNQGQENSGWATPEKIKALVANIKGLDAKAFGTCLDSHKYTSRVQELKQLGGTSGVQGTPTAFIGNDQKGYAPLVGAVPYSQVKQQIDSLLQ